MSDRKRESAEPGSDRAGLCRATNRRGGACGKKALRDGLCLVHSGEQDMRAVGRKGGRAYGKAKRRQQDDEREGYRAHLRRELDPAELTAAIKTGLASPNERDRLAAAKLAFAELYEPGRDRVEQDQQADLAAAKERLASKLDALAARAALRTLVEQGVIRPGLGGRPDGRPFEGVVRFDLRGIAEWAGAWAPRPVEVFDVACATCGKPGVRIVAEGETVDGGPVYCAACEPGDNGAGRSGARRICHREARVVEATLIRQGRRRRQMIELEPRRPDMVERGTGGVPDVGPAFRSGAVATLAGLVHRRGHERASEALIRWAG